jgi:hypothetical protein
MAKGLCSASIRLPAGPSHQARLYGHGVSESTADLRQPCQIHEMENCAICWPPERTYRKGQGPVEAPPGSYVSIHGGRGVYHHPDCFNVTGDWDGADAATLGQRVIHSAAELADSDLRPAECCQPPLFRR